MQLHTHKQSQINNNNFDTILVISKRDSRTLLHQRRKNDEKKYWKNPKTWPKNEINFFIRIQRITSLVPSFLKKSFTSTPLIWLDKNAILVKVCTFSHVSFCFIRKNQRTSKFNKSRVFIYMQWRLLTFKRI